jgi:glutathione S-transferase
VTFLDAEVSAKPLFPEDPTVRKQVVDRCQRLDDELGPAVRTLARSGMIDHTGYAIRVFGRDQPSIKLFFYRRLFPLLRSVIGKANGVNPENIKQSESIATRYLDKIDDAIQTTGYLVGSEFTAADPAAAALLAPLAGLEHSNMKLPEPVVESFKIIVNRYSEHPAIRWVKEQYRQHRNG